MGLNQHWINLKKGMLFNLEIPESQIFPPNWNDWKNKKNNRQVIAQAKPIDFP